MSGWASALGAAILGGQKAYRDADALKREREQLALENQIRQQQLADSHQAALQAAILNQDRINELPKQHARADLDDIIKTQGREAAYGNPAAIQAAAAAGIPFALKDITTPRISAIEQQPAGLPNGLNPGASIPSAKQVAGPGVDPTTGAILPPDIVEAQLARARQEAGRQQLVNAGGPAAQAVAYHDVTNQALPPSAFQKYQLEKITDPLGGQHAVVFDPSTGTVKGGGGGNSGGAPSSPGADIYSLTGDELLKHLSPKDANVVKGLSQYKFPIGQGIGGVKMLQYYAPLVSAYDPTWNAGDYNNRMALMKNYSSGSRAQIATSIDQVLHHLNSLQQAGDDLHNVSVPVIGPEVNKAKNFLFNRTSGLQDVQRINSRAVASELAKIYKGTGASAEKEIGEWANSMDLNDKSPEAQKLILRKGAELLNGALTAHRDTFQRGIGKPMDFSLISPEQQKSLDVLLGNQPQFAPAQGASGGMVTIVAPTGETRQVSASDAQKYIAAGAKVLKQ